MGAEAAKQKEKTKAKQRYLKAKKERRKKRKSVAAPTHTSSTAQKGHVPEEESASESDGQQDNEEDDEADVEAMEVDTVVPASHEQDEGEHESKEERAARKEQRRKEKKERKAKAEQGDIAPETRPRKRRKLTPPVQDEEEPTPAPEPELDETTIPQRTPTPPPPSSLPSFPLPSRPDAPAKSELASQGLDRALAHAQIIDAGLVMPLDEGAGLSPRTTGRLKELGITELFAVQTTLIPLLLPAGPQQRALYLPYSPPNDICVSAPTGSGKTLAYVLPIVETLCTRIVTRLRALVVLPTRDLVTQVRETFEAVGKGRGLKIGTATGQHSFAHEQSQLIADKSPYLQGGSSKVDILICTPGRLMDHLNGTPNFSLQHLRYLVIDEADRLLAQSFQDWLAQVLAATRPPTSAPASFYPSIDPSTHLPYPDALAPAFLPPDIHTDIDEPKASSCQKLLFSATLMSDPGRIAALELRDPQYLVVQQQGVHEGVLGVVMEQFSMPATLKEHMVVCDSAQKPLVLFHLVHARGVRGALVFTKSAEATQRLVRLFEFFEQARLTAGADADAGKPIVIRAYSSDLAAGERKAILEKFKAQEIDLLVCSDLISRGIDISHVAHVVSYDVPVDMRKYVHRVGRTARAGREGDAWTLVEEQEARYFKEMLKAAEHADKVARVRVSDKQLEPLVPFYEGALRQLRDVYGRDRRTE